MTPSPDPEHNRFVHFKLFFTLFKQGNYIQYISIITDHWDMISLGNVPPRGIDLLDPQTSPKIPTQNLPPTILAKGRAESYLKVIFVEWYEERLASIIDIYVLFN